MLAGSQLINEMETNYRRRSQTLKPARGLEARMLLISVSEAWSCLTTSGLEPEQN